MSYSLLNPTGGQPLQYHLIPNLSFTPTVERVQGPHLNIGTYSTPSFDFPPPSVPSFEMPTIHSHQSATGLYKGTVSAFVKSEVPDFKIAPELKTVGVAYSAFKTADKLVKNIDKALDQGQAPEEAYVCQSLRTLTEEISGNAMKGFIVGGIPPYLLAATTNPMVTATVPFVLPMIPSAYQGADVAAQLAGQGIEAMCHSGFDTARNILQEGEHK